ncbi:MAG: malate synthase A [bacterium]
MKSIAVAPEILVKPVPADLPRHLLSPEALRFLVGLHERFEARRQAVLRLRRERQAAIDAGAPLAQLEATRPIREASWRVTPPPPDLVDRCVEITGPTDRRMMLHALNSGAQVYMADFEDATVPTWRNLLEGQANLMDVVRGTIAAPTSGGAPRTLAPHHATLVVRPRGWHLDEPRVAVGGRPISASLFDAGLFIFHNAQALLFHGSGPYLYLPKMESHVEARLWHDILTAAEESLGLPRNAVRTTVLIETLPAALEMDEILYELRERSPALNAGRWDYLFSALKTLRARPGFVLPDRADLTMTQPFMWAYTQLLVQTCHRRGAYAIGGMAAYVPSRKDPARNELALAKVREDKVREAGQGFDGTWVAHPDLVPVALETFRTHMAERTNQLHVHGDARIGAPDLLCVQVPSGAVTQAGLQSNVRVAIAYLASWLAGTGAVAIDSLMEDTATAEIARAQVWQWVHQGVVLEDARTVTADLVRAVARDQLMALRADDSLAPAARAHLDAARSFFDLVALQDPFVEFLTIPGMGLLKEDAP